jgi:hypothetical protein
MRPITRTLATALLGIAFAIAPALPGAALALVPGASGAALAVEPGVAQAAETAALHVGFSPYRLGRSTTLKIALKLGVAGSDNGLPSPVTRFDMGIPANMELIASSLGLAICRPAALLTGGIEGCSPNARIGYGSAEIKVPVGPEAVPEAASIDAEMGPPVEGQIGVLLYTEAGAPVAAQLIFPGVLFGGSGANGQSLDTSVPLIPTLPGAPDISMVSMNLSLGPDRLTYYEQVRGKTVAYRPEGISLPTSCPRGGFRFTSDISFLDGSTVRAASTVPCPPPRR